MKLELEEPKLTDFVTCVDKTFVKPRQVCFEGNSSGATLYIAQDARQVSLSIPGEFKDFKVSVEAKKFIQAVKNLYGAHAVFDFKVKHVNVTYGNVSIKLPYIVSDSQWTPRESAEFGVTPEFFEALNKTLCVDDDDQRFYGILLDPLQDGTLVAKFSGTLLILTKVPDRFTTRLVIPADFAKVTKSKLVIDNLLYSPQVFGLQTNNQIKLVSSYMESQYPDSFLGAFKMSDVGTLVNPEEFDFSYEFDAQELKNVVNLVSSIIGEEEYALSFKIEGKEPQSGAFVWCVSSKSCSGLTAEEKIRSTGVVKGDPKVFKLHKKQLKKVLDNYTGTIRLLDHKSFVLLSDETGNQAALLSKLG